jgi:hypothetical protein
MYNRNKAAYNAYVSMVDKYGRNSVNSLKGVSEKQMATILRDIDQYEKTNQEGRAIAARDGYYADKVSSTQPRGRVPSPTPNPVPADQNEAYLRDKAEFMGRQANREVDKLFKEASPRIPGFSGVSPLSMTTPILRFFNVIPDATDAAMVEKTYQSLKDDIEVK